MKIALLVCDHVPEHLQTEHGTYPEMFRDLFKLPMNEFYVCDGDFPPLDEYDAFICTGSGYSVYDEDSWIIELQEFTRKAYQTGKKFIGVCFGHQLIAESLGGKVQRSDSGFLIGIHSFEMLRRYNWMDPFEQEYHVLMLCQDQVVKLPEKAEVLAKSNHCPIGAFRLGDHFLGIQGHPEFTNEYNRALIEYRLDDKYRKRKEYALRSFNEKQADRVRLAAYLRNFLT